LAFFWLAAYTVKTNTMINAMNFECDKYALLPHMWGKGATVVGQMCANKIPFSVYSLLILSSVQARKLDVSNEGTSCLP
jgi:hypothetical protein